MTQRSAKQWAGLSPAYRERLTRSGISKASYMEGANLQSARGQRIEANRTSEHGPGESPATVRKWKARAKARGVSATDWQTAVQTSPFSQVRSAVIAKEQAHRSWRDAGSPNLKARRERKQRIAEILTANTGRPTSDEEGDLEYYDDGYADTEDWNFQNLLYEEVDDVTEWGDSWGYYH